MMEASAYKLMQEKINYGDQPFVWTDYLDATESSEVPDVMFPHVERTLESSIEVGMSLEVPTSKNDDGDVTYWVASVVVACGPLLRMRHFAGGANDKNLEFWFNLTKESAHELGWCVRNDKKLEPPEIVLKKSSDCLEKLPEFLMAAKSIPQEMLTGEGLSMMDRIKSGMKVEVSDLQHPYKLWVATIIENVGGRLLLRYDTPGARVKSFWMFCTSEHVHSYGFASKSDPKWFLEPPSSIVETHAYEEWKGLTESGPNTDETSGKLFDQSVQHPRHRFKVGMKLEAVVPNRRTVIAPATVTKVFDDIYFLVKIDNHAENGDSKTDKAAILHCATAKDTWLCHAGHPYVFPIGWAKKNGLAIANPLGWESNGEEFVWSDYLTATKSVGCPAEWFADRESAVEAGYEVGMHLEAVNPRDENEICAAKITRIIDDILWIKLEDSDDRRDHIVHMGSTQIFPVGWCETNRYPLKPPLDHVEVCQKLRGADDDEKKMIVDVPLSEPRTSLWCPAIYFNYRCYTGPMISKGKLASLPRVVGPGPVNLVMKEVVSMIVSVGYRTARILKILQCDTKPEPGFHLEVIKAKHKTNTCRGNVAVITSGDMVVDFCKNICKKLMVCPNLFGPLCVTEEDCPDQCHKASKNKFVTTATGTAKRGKSKSSDSQAASKSKVFGARRKRRRGRWANRDKDGAATDEPKDESPCLSPDSAKRVAEGTDEAMDDGAPLSENDVATPKGIEKSDDLKVEALSSNASEDSRSSFNDPKGKDSNVGSPASMNSKTNSANNNQNGSTTRSQKRDREWDTSVETDCSEADAEYVRMQKTQRRPKTRKLDSNPLFWSAEDVFRYLRKTNDCKDIAYRVKEEEIDGLAFLLLNLPSLTDHMKMRTSLAMKLCRHVEQVKVTFFLRHINEVEPEQYKIV